MSSRAVFQNASQIVPGDLVEVSGLSIGTVSDISLTPDGQAQLTLNIKRSQYEPLRAGTQATVREASLSGIANRYIDLRLGPASGAAIRNGGVIPTTDTTSAVDLDQLFNTLNFLPDFLNAALRVITAFGGTGSGGSTSGGLLTSGQGDRCPGSMERGSSWYPESGYPCNRSQVPTGK